MLTRETKFIKYITHSNFDGCHMKEVEKCEKWCKRGRSRTFYIGCEGSDRREKEDMRLGSEEEMGKCSDAL